MKKKKVDIFIDIVVLFLVVVVAIYLSLRSLSAFLQSREYFRIQYVKSNDSSMDVSYLKGRNIFSLDLAQEADRLRTMYPAYQSIKLVKYLPNCLYVEFKKRRALAYVKLSRYFLVGEDAVLFNGDTQTSTAELPVILGLETKIYGPKAGIRYNIRELTLALDLVRQFNSIPALQNCKISKINVSNPANMSFYILNNIEIRVGQEDIGSKIKLLPSLMAHIGQNLTKLRYIDLRFKEPVIKYKDEI